MINFAKKIKIKNDWIGNNCNPYLVAEISANHNGSIKTAIKTMSAAKKSGANAIKLQTYTPDTMTLNSKRKDFYINSGKWKGSYLYDLYKNAHTPFEWHQDLFNYAKKLDITCFSSAFDESAVDLLEKIGTPAYKIASFEATDFELIYYASSTMKPIIISTGLATEFEIKKILEVVSKTGNKKVVVLHCVSSYPAKFENYNLKTLTDISNKFKVLVGISDHTLDNIVCNASVPLGSCFFEKHFILKRSLGGPDSSFSLEPNEFSYLKKSILNIHKTLGKVNYNLKGEEKFNIKFRRSIYASTNIKKGDKFSINNIKKIRPGYGLEPEYYKKIIGSYAKNNISFGKKISRKDCTFFDIKKNNIKDKKKNKTLKIGIGTAQFGLNYGISNNKGVSKYSEIRKILLNSYLNNINFIDLAENYGDSLTKIKKYFDEFPNQNWDICFKVSRDLKNFKDLNSKLNKIFFKINKMPNIIMFHNYIDIIKYGKLIDRKLLKSKSIKIGCSLYYKEELIMILKNKINIDIIQVPMNLLDKRFCDKATSNLLKKNNIQIHARSIFLQGLFFLSNKEIKNHFPNLDLNKIIDKSNNNLNKYRIYELSLLWILKNKFVDKIILGFETSNQLNKILNIINNKKINKYVYDYLSNINITDEKIILPINWDLNNK